MPNRDPKADKELKAAFELEFAEDGQTMQAKCKAKREDEEACPASWELELDDQGALFIGSRNSLLAHARSHQSGFKRMRRLS